MKNDQTTKDESTPGGGDVGCAHLLAIYSNPTLNDFRMIAATSSDDELLEIIDDCKSSSDPLIRQDVLAIYQDEQKRRNRLSAEVSYWEHKFPG